MFDAEIEALAKSVIRLCADKRLTVATAESCTGGLVAGALTEISGSSSVVDRGFVTYSNAAKQAMIGVNGATLEAHGAVSRETALEMAQGILRFAPVSLAVAITGVAGPTGGTPQKPVGLVHFCAASRGGQLVPVERRFDPTLSRSAIRRASVIQALGMLLDAARQET